MAGTRTEHCPVPPSYVVCPCLLILETRQVDPQCVIAILLEIDETVWPFRLSYILTLRGLPFQKVSLSRQEQLKTYHSDSLLM